MPYMTSFINILRPGETDIFKLRNVTKILAPGETVTPKPTPEVVVEPEPAPIPSPEPVVVPP